jgi:hypothetical protein
MQFLVCICHSVLFQLCYLFKEPVICVYFVILFFMLLTRYKHIFNSLNINVLILEVNFEKLEYRKGG